MRLQRVCIRPKAATQARARAPAVEPPDENSGFITAAQRGRDEGTRGRRQIDPRCFGLRPGIVMDSSEEGEKMFFLVQG